MSPPFSQVTAVRPSRRPSADVLQCTHHLIGKWGDLSIGGSLQRCAIVRSD